MNHPDEPSTQTEDAAVAPPASSAIGSRADFVLALLAAVRSALSQRARRMVWVDRDFAEWPLDDPVLLDALTQWLRLPQRRLVLLADGFDDVTRRSPRFVDWYRLWTHVVNAFSPEPDDRAELPSQVLVEGTSVLRLMDRERWRGRSSVDATEVRLCRDGIDALLQRAGPAFPASTLGL